MAQDGHTPARQWLRRLGIGAAALAVLVAVVWLGGPPAIKAGIVWGLDRYAGATASIDEIGIDLHPLAMELRGVRIVPTGGGDGISFRRAHAGLGFRALFDRRVLLRDVALDGLALPLRRSGDDAWRAGGFALPEPDEDDDDAEGWRVGLVDLVLTDARIHVQDRRIDETLVVERLALGDLFTWSPDSETSMAIAAGLAGADLNVQASGRALEAPREGRVHLRLEKLPLAPFAPLLEPQGVTALGGEISFDLTLSGSRAADGTTRAEADGSIVVSGLEAETSDGSVKAGTLSWKGKVVAGRAAPQSPSEVEIDGALGLAGVDASDGERRVALDALDWSGTAGLRLETSGAANVKIDGKLALGKLALRPPGNSPGLRLGRLEWQGQGEARRSSDAADVQASGDGKATAENVAVDSADGTVRLVSADRVALDALSARSPGTVSLRGARLRGLALNRRIEDGKATDDRAPAIVRELTVEKASYAPDDGLNLGAMQAGGAALTVEYLGEAGIVDILPSLGGDGPEPKPKPARGSTNGGTGMAVSVAGLSVGEDSRVILIDRSQEPTLEVTIRPVEIVVGSFDTTKPDAQTPVELSLGLPAGGAVALEGTAVPLAEELTGSIRLSIKQMELPSISPAARRYLGLTLRTGRLDGDLNISAASGVLDGKGSVGIARLQVEISDPEQARPLTSQIPVSLGNALGLLRDGDGTIRLEVPIAGNASDPKFDLSNVINRAIGRAMATAALTTVKVLFPLGALAEAIIDAQGKTHFAPLQFEAGSAAVGPKGREYLDQLARLLRERPGINIAICGKATPADRAALLEAKGRSTAARPGEGAGRLPWRSPSAQDAPAAQPSLPATAREVTTAELEALAAARAEAARRQLIAGSGIGDSRLLQCVPAAETGEEAQPRVEITL